MASPILLAKSGPNAVICMNQDENQHLHHELQVKFLQSMPLGQHKALSGPIKPMSPREWGVHLMISYTILLFAKRVPTSMSVFKPTCYCLNLVG